MNNEEYCELLGVCLHKPKYLGRTLSSDDTYRCIRCGIFLNPDSPDLKFLDPGDKELGVMLRWCLSKERLTVSLSLGTDLETYFCVLEKPRYKSGEYEGKSEALALAKAIEAWKEQE